MDKISSFKAFAKQNKIDPFLWRMKNGLHTTTLSENDRGPSAPMVAKPGRKLESAGKHKDLYRRLLKWQEVSLEDYGINSKKQGMFGIGQDKVVHGLPQQIMTDTSCKQRIETEQPKGRRPQNSFLWQCDEGSQVKQSETGPMELVRAHAGKWCAVH
ncbi:hypothetical protein TNCV_4358721 [Trichonephila clavipes]|nr:hypothetical protein TNCV_4358721 [Trichonephila clavipes]